MNKQEIYKAHINMIRKAAWKYAQQYAIDFQELMSEGNEIFMNALASHDPEKSKFGTHLTWQLYRLGDYCKAVARHNDRFVPVGSKDDYTDSRIDYKHDYATLAEHKRKASDSVKEILEIVENYEGNYGRATYNSVQKQLRAQNRSKQQIQQAWGETTKWWRSYEAAEKEAIK